MCFPKLSQAGCTALITAATNDHVECVRVLLEAGADKEAEDEVCVRENAFCFVFDGTV
jgi:hypothetical protein